MGIGEGGCDQIEKSRYHGMSKACAAKQLARVRQRQRLPIEVVAQEVVVAGITSESQ